MYKLEEAVSELRQMAERRTNTREQMARYLARVKLVLASLDVQAYREVNDEFVKERFG